MSFLDNTCLLYTSTDSYPGSYENPNNDFEDDAMDADFESVDD